MERRISGHTKLYGLIGSPVGHSGSPAMYNYSFEKLGIDAAYLAFDVPLEKTEDALNALRTLNVGGFNVTMPCKRQWRSLWTGFLQPQSWWERAIRSSLKKTAR